MNWMRISVHTTTAGAEAVVGVLMDLGVNGAQVEDRLDALSEERAAGSWDVIDRDVIEKMPEDVVVTCYIQEDDEARALLREYRERLDGMRACDMGFDVGTLEIDTELIDEQDWAANWKAGFTPLRLGEKTVIKPTWEEFEARPGDRVIEMDPGMAFGTGTHETTAMCVYLVEKYVATGDKAIDVGTGTGILAMTAALAGAGEVLAIDIDAVAVRVAGENVARNGLAGVVRTVRGDLLEAASGMTADVVIANIITDIVMPLAEPVRNVLREGGIFVCSGISRNRADEVQANLVRLGYTVIERRENGEWAAFASRR